MTAPCLEGQEGQSLGEMFNAFPNEDSVTPEVCKDYLDADPNVTQHIVRYENLNADLRFVSLGFGIRQKLWPHCLDNKASLCVDVFRRLGLYNITFKRDSEKLQQLRCL